MTVPTLTDSWTLVQRLKTGDQTALDQLYRNHHPAVLKFIRFRISNQATAEDLAGDVWIRALRGLNTFTYDGTGFAAWLTTIARNLVFDHLKSSAVRRSNLYDPYTNVDGEGFREYLFDSVDASPEGTPADTAIASIRAVPLWAAVQGLKPDQRLCILLRFKHGFSVAEAGRLMGKKNGAIKALQYRATNNLRIRLGRDFDDDMPDPRPMR